MGKVYKRGGRYWASYIDSEGKPRRRSTKTTDREVAKQRLRDYELERPSHRASHDTLGDALKHLLKTVYAGRNESTVASYDQKARHLVRILGSTCPLSHITRQRCHEYRAQRIKEGAKAHSVYKEFVVLRLALKEQDIEGVVPKVSADYKPRDRYLTLEQFSAVMGHLPVERQLWFKAACFLGARDSELAKLRWEDLDLKHKLIRVRGTKTRGADRVVPVHDVLIPTLRAAKKDKGPIIEPWTNRRRDVTAAYWKAIGYDPGPKWSRGTKRGGKSIKGAPRISPNDLRRTFISWLKQGGVDSLVAAKLAGTGVRMVETVYGQIDQETMRDAMKQLRGPR